MRTPITLGCATLVTLFSGCTQPSLRASADSDLPSERALAAARASEDDTIELARLVSLLESTDSAVRLLASRALIQRTGETLGYHHADPELVRALAVERWEAYVRSLDENATIAD